MTDFNSTVDTIMSSFKDEKKNRWTGKTPDGDVWAAGLMPSRKELVVILYDKMRGEEKTIRIKDTEKDKLISTFRELYDDSRKSNKEDLGEDTVYDHSWYEVEKQKYPKRTKEGVIIKESYDEPIQDTDWNSFVQKIGKRYLVGNTLCWQHLKTYIKVTKNGNVYIMQHNDILRRAFTDCKTFDDIYDKLYTKNLLPSVTESHITEAKNENNDEIERIHNEYLENKLNAFQAIEDLYIYTNFSTKEIDEILYKWLEEKEKIKSDKEEKELNETCSAGATCAGSVSPVSIPMGKIAKRKRKKVSEDVDSILFKESILNDMPCESEINNHKFKYFMNEGKWYMGVDNCLVKTFDKGVMMETFDQIVDEMPVSASLLEDYSCYEMDLLMEEDDTTVNPTSTDSDLTTSSANADMNSENLVNAAYAHEAQQAVDAEEDSSEIKSSEDIAKEEMHNQEILGNNNGEVAFKNDDDIETGIQKDSKTVSVTDKSGQNKDIEMVTIQKQDGKEIMLPASEVDKVK